MNTARRALRRAASPTGADGGSRDITDFKVVDLGKGTRALDEDD